MRPKRPLREEAFDILTPESCYWMGLILANGCISYKTQNKAPARGWTVIVINEPIIKVDVHEIDREMLEGLKEFLGSSNQIYQAKGRRTVSLVVRSSRLARALAKQGILPRGSLSSGLKEVSNSIDFWRGVFDSKARFHPDKEITICERSFVLDSFYDFLSKKFTWTDLFISSQDIKSGKKWTLSGNGDLRGGGEEFANSSAVKVLSYLYDGAKIVNPKRQMLQGIYRMRI